jgi:hypothetical protein
VLYREVLKEISLALMLRIFLPSASGHDVLLIVRDFDDIAEVTKRLLQISKAAPVVEHGASGTLATYPPLNGSFAGRIAMLTPAQEETLKQMREEAVKADNKNLLMDLTAQLRSLVQRAPAPPRKKDTLGDQLFQLTCPAR